MTIAFDPQKEFTYTAEGGTILICRYMSVGQWICLRDSQRSLMKIDDVCDYSEQLAKLLTDPMLGPVQRVEKAFDLDGAPLEASLSQVDALLQAFTPAGLNSLPAMITRAAEISELDEKKSRSQRDSAAASSPAVANGAALATPGSPTHLSQADSPSVAPGVAETGATTAQPAQGPVSA